LGDYVKKAWFLDRDGTIIVDQHYLKDPEKVVLLDNAAQALKEAQDAGYLLIVVTNQSGIARGYFTPEEADKVDERLSAMLEKEGVRIAKTYRCPHLPDGIPPYNVTCDCRKPDVGLFKQAIADFDLNPKECIACGDKLRDIENLHQLGLPEEGLGLIGKEDGKYTDLLSFFCAVSCNCE